MKKIDWSTVSYTPSSKSIDEDAIAVNSFDQKFSLLLNRHLYILLAWCIINWLVCIPLLWYSNHWLWYFSLMNICWGGINYLIVFFLFRHISVLPSHRSTIFQRYEVYWHVKSLLLLNIGLDTAYIIAGLYLRSFTNDPEMSYTDLWYGFGISVILQGIFLFLLDNIFHYYHLINFRSYLQKTMTNQDGEDKNKHSRI